MAQPDICIVGAGVIGLSLALELAGRGAQVTVLERGRAMGEASQAAAGMLAADDPENPPGLAELAQLSLRLYPAFLRRIEELSGQAVPIQTTATYQAVDHEMAATSGAVCDLPAPFRTAGRPFVRFAEMSLDPRQLAPALAAAIRSTPVHIVEGSMVREVGWAGGEVRLETTAGSLRAGLVVHTAGAWSGGVVRPKKGQMLSVRLPRGLALDAVVRTPEVYVVPRLLGPRAGQAVIGATVEDAGFSAGTDAASLRGLRRLAARLMAELGDERTTPAVASWAGHRPHTPDQLPIIGVVSRGADGRPLRAIATGHYRNGMLLAPATARVMADLLMGRETEVSLDAFDPGRFGLGGDDRTASAIFAHVP